MQRDGPKASVSNAIIIIACNIPDSDSVKYGNMKIQNLKSVAKSAVFITVLTSGVSLRAAIPALPQPLSDTVTGPNQFQTVAFSEANTLTSAYLILATGDHDYKGHRVKAMHQIEAAGKLLGVSLHGDDKDRQKQVLSDDKLREVRGMLETVLGAAEVKSQPRVSKHVNAAIEQIDIALRIR